VIESLLSNITISLISDIVYKWIVKYSLFLKDQNTILSLQFCPTTEVYKSQVHMQEEMLVFEMGCNFSLYNSAYRK